MESYNDIKSLSKSTISSVSYDFIGTSIKTSYLVSYLYPIVEDCTLEELNESLISCCEKLKLLKIFNECNIEVHPGKELNTASVLFNLSDKRTFGALIDTKADPFRVYIEFYKRILFERANQSSVKIGINPNNYNLDYELSHLEKLSFIKGFQQKFVIGKYSNNLDINLLEKNDMISVIFKSLDGKHQIQYGKSIRKNLVTIQNSSKNLINITPAVTDKNFLSYTLTLDKIDNIRSSIFGWYLGLNNELATGKDLFYHKISTDFSGYLRLVDNIFLINHIHCGFFMPWPSTNIKINDNFRITNFRGFDRIGYREPPHDPNLNGRFSVNGDHLGSNIFASLQSKLLLYKFPFFSNLGMRPFVYGSLAYLKERPGVLDNLRGAVGFGLNYHLNIGYFEIVYTSKVWKKNGDIPAEIQFLIYSRY